MDPSFLETDPPPLAARGLSLLLVCIVVVAALLAAVVKLPETVSAPFVLVPGSDPVHGAKLRAELTIPQSGLARIRPGLPVKLLYESFPYQRYGVRSGTVTSAGPSSDTFVFRAFVELAEQSVVVDGEPRPLLPGMRGTALVVVGRRSALGYAFAPLRRAQELVK